MTFLDLCHYTKRDEIKSLTLAYTPDMLKNSAQLFLSQGLSMY